MKTRRRPWGDSPPQVDSRIPFQWLLALRNTRDFLKEYVRQWVSPDPIAVWRKDQHIKYTQAMEHMKVTIAIALQKCEADVYLRFSDRVRVLRAQAAGAAA